MTTYGAHLDLAAGALASLHVGMRANARPDPQEQAIVAQSRQRIYHALATMLRLHSVAPLALPRHQEQWAPQAIAAASTWLAASTTSTVAVTFPRDLAAPEDGVYRRIVTASVTAADNLAAAADILASHLGPGPTYRAQTTEGIAVLGGVGTVAAVKDITTLAAAAARIDTALSRWFRPDLATNGAWQPVVLAAHADAQRTATTAAEANLADIAKLRVSVPAAATDLTRALPVADPAPWTSAADAIGVIRAIDAARAWLIQNPNQLTARDLELASASTAAITHQVGYLLSHTGSPANQTRAAVTAATGPWRIAATTAGNMRSPILPDTPRTTLVTALNAADQWLRDQLRPDGQWRPLHESAPATDWKTTARDIAARLPDLAAALRLATASTRATGGLLAIIDTHTDPNARPRWSTVQQDTPVYQHLVHALNQARAGAKQLADLAGTPVRLGVADAPELAQHHAAALAAEGFAVTVVGAVLPQAAAATSTTARRRRPAPTPGTS